MNPQLELGGGETRKMLEYRRQLDKEREGQLKARKRKKKHSSHQVNSSSEDDAEVVLLPMCLALQLVMGEE